MCSVKNIAKSINSRDFNMVKVCSRPQTIYAVGVAMTYGVLVVKTIVVRKTIGRKRPTGSNPVPTAKKK